MSNEMMIGFSELKAMAEPMMQCKFFGFNSASEALALMMIAQAEGMHPALAAKEYHVINGKPALKADAMLSRFQRSGGSVNWTRYDDTVVVGEFSHPQGGSVSVRWDSEMADRAGLLTGKNAHTWKKYMRAMLRSRCISEGIRTVFPGVISGFYTEEEVESFTQEKNNPVKNNIVLDVEKVDPAIMQETVCIAEEITLEKKVNLKFAEDAQVIKEAGVRIDPNEDKNKFLLDALRGKWFALCKKYMDEHSWFSVPKNYLKGMHEILKLAGSSEISGGFVVSLLGERTSIEQRVIEYQVNPEQEQELEQEAA